MATIAVQSRVAHVRDEAAYMVCGLWMIIGLYVDGWSHQANKPETFFTPWHLLLYSGFGAAIVYSGYMTVRDAKAGIPPAVGDDKVTTIGIAVFSVGAMGDFLWHSLVGIEVDIEGLISPTHLALMIGGLLMVTLPVRSALRTNEDAPGLPVFASISLALGVASFFLLYLTPWSASYAFEATYVPESDLSNYRVASGMATVVITTALFVGAMAWTARRWTLPFGMATIAFTAVAFGLAGQSGFDVGLSILAATIGGLAFDVLHRDGRPLPIVGAVTGTVLFAAFFALHHAEEGVGWSPSLWAGAVVFAGLTGYGMGIAVRER